MVNKEILRQIVIQQKADVQTANGTVKRELLSEIQKWLKETRVLILTGIRRSGKSTLLKQIMGVTPKYCYVNFEDERFIDFKAQDFEELHEVLLEVYPDPHVYFFDEVQNIARFETFVRRLQDQGKKVILTGSNASLLSKELGTRLTGRYKPFEVYPFSFSEFLAFKGMEPTTEWFYLTDKKVKLLQAFDEYIVRGGFPEYLKNKDREYLRTVYENILYRDIIARYAIKKQKPLRELVNLLATNVSSLFTYNALKKELHLSNAITVKEYISYLGNSYLFFEVQRYEYALKKQLNAPKKIYLIDPALHEITGSTFSLNKGRVLENVVFIELKRRKKEVYYHSGKSECDFIIKEGVRIKEAIQVCYGLDNKNRDRELSGLLEAMKKYKLKEGIILTKEQEETIEREGKRVRVIPTWRWLLKKE